MTGGLYDKIRAHLFPGDGGEHGAVILAGLAETETDFRLLAREECLAQDGLDYVQGKRAHRQLMAEFITPNVMKARDEGLVYLAVHNHCGDARVRFSRVDLQSHERGYPGLLQIAQGQPVGALVFAQNAIAGDIWLTQNRRVPLSDATIVGRRRLNLTPKPDRRARHFDPMYDRQTRLFGKRGQSILREAKVAIIGLGGVGSLLAEYLGRLGVGKFVLIDPDRIEQSNLPRLVGARRQDVGLFKVDVAKRNIRRANRNAQVQTLPTSLAESQAPAHIMDCDYLFLAADSMWARQIFNSIVHQYLIPGVQIGAKVSNEQVFTVTRPVTPEQGCLSCSSLIDPVKLSEETTPEIDRRRWQYVDDPEVVAPSVIALNALPSAQAVNDFMFYMTGLMEKDTSLDYMRFQPKTREVCMDKPVKIANCLACSLSGRSRFARGDSQRLPVKMS